MKILEINAYYDFGSTGHIVKDLCDEGTRCGFEMYAIYWLRRKRNVENQYVLYCGEDATPSFITNAAHWVILGGSLNYNRERTKKIIRQIQLIKPDIIHLHNLHGDFEYGSIDIELFLDAIAECNCRVIWTFHDCWPITGRCYYFEYTNCLKWRTGCGNCPQRFYDREGIFRDRTAENIETKNKLYSKIKNLTIITVSDWLKKIVKESILKNRKVVTIYNGINVEIFKYNPTVNEHSGILCIGWDRRKGFDDYIEIAKILPSEQIYVLGQRPLFRKCKKLPSNVHEVGLINNSKEMASLYNKMSVYFNASRAETFGLTTVEALACGVPVVGYNNSATPEIIGKYGECVDNRNIEMIVNAIIKIQEIDDNNRKIERSEYAHRYFSKYIMINKYMKILKEC